VGGLYAPANAGCNARNPQPRHPVTNPPAERLSFREKLAYGLGDTASNFCFQAINIFLAGYYTDIAGLNPADAGTLMFVVPFAVAFLNPAIGALADRTNTRWGKFRPYLLWSVLPYGIFACLLFTSPAAGAGTKLIYAYVTYTLMLVVYAFINTPYGALMGVMSPSSEDRTSLNSFRFACAFLGAFLIGGFVLDLKVFLTPAGGSEADGFRNTMVIFAVLSVAIFLFTFFNTRERVADPAGPKGSLGQDLADLKSNGPWLVLLVVGILNLTNVGLRNGAGYYYFKYAVGNELALGNFNKVGFLCFIAGALATKFFTARWPRRALMIWLTLINGAGMLACYFIDPQNLTGLYIANIIASFAAGPTPAIVWSLYADTADYSAWKHGRRATGLLISAMVLGHKLSMALGGAMIGWLLAYYGFVANAVQTPAALHGIALIFSLIPGACALGSGLAVFFYPLDEKQMKQIEHDLAARKAAAVPA
jgi:GPH family glycoside/pentoside/hexuronide:cation symporter